MRRKVTVVGAGKVGTAVAQRLAERDYADVVLLDPLEGLPQATALDLNQAGPVVGYEANALGTNGWEHASGSDVVVLTSEDSLEETGRQVADRAPDAVAIVVTEPVDVSCHVTLDVTRFPRQRVIGMGALVDSAHFRMLVAWELNVSARDVTALVIGGRGDAMVPLLSSASVGGAPLAQLLPEERLRDLVRRARGGGAVAAAFHAASAAAVEMVDAVLLDQRRVLPCVALCDGEYGIDGGFVGVPVKLGRDGIEEILEIELAADERASLQAAAAAARERVRAASAAS